jgi:hypothetical protein
MVGPKVRVHVSSPRNVILYRKPAGTSSWSKACDSPCNMELPIGDTYRVAGNHIAQSKEFKLEASAGGTVDVVIDPPSGGGMVLGGVLAGVGGTAAWVGALLTLVGAANAGRDCTNVNGYYGTQAQCEQDKANGPAVRNGGLVTMGVGAAVAGLGLVVFFNSATTDLEQHRGGGDRAGDGKKDAFVREPAWRSSVAKDSNGGVPAASFPVIWSGTF